MSSFSARTLRKRNDEEIDKQSHTDLLHLVFVSWHRSVRSCASVETWRTWGQTTSASMRLLLLLHLACNTRSSVTHVRIMGIINACHLPSPAPHCCTKRPVCSLWSGQISRTYDGINPINSIKCSIVVPWKTLALLPHISKVLVLCGVYMFSLYLVCL